MRRTSTNRREIDEFQSESADSASFLSNPASKHVVHSYAGAGTLLEVPLDKAKH
jgi:hypothetical protein